MSEVDTTANKPSPILVIAAFTETFKAVLGEVRSLAAEAFKFQLALMELLPAEHRLEAFRLVLDANTAYILSDERVTLALFSTVEKMGAAAAQIIPPLVAMRHEEIKDRRRETADREAVAGMKTAK